MERKTKRRMVWLVLLTALAVVVLLPSVLPKGTLPPAIARIFDKKIQLGLDLKGGRHIVYGIALDRAVEDKATEVRRNLSAKLEEIGVEGRATTPKLPLGAVRVTVTKPEDLARIDKAFLSDYGDIISVEACPADVDAKTSVCARVASDFADGIKKSALKQAIRTIKERINERGVAEPSVVEKNDQIIVELPGDDPDETQRVKDLLEKTAKLEFKMVDSGADGQGTDFMKRLYAHVQSDETAKSLGITAESTNWSGGEGKAQKNFRDYYLVARDEDRRLSVAEARELGCYESGKEGSDGKVPCTVQGRAIIAQYLEDLRSTKPGLAVDDEHQFGYELAQRRDADNEIDEVWTSYYLFRAVELSGSSVTDAIVYFDQTTNEPKVSVDFDRAGGRRFGDMTTANIGRKMAIILDNKVTSAPIIQGAITGGSTSISMGSVDRQQAMKDSEILRDVLRTGSLAAPIQEESSSLVGPLLGRDAIEKAKLSFMIGSGLVVLIMIFYYRFSGVISIVALALNLLFMMAVLAGFQAVLTLPGIAALVLTVGMAVDANIIIYERIREELRSGKSVGGAVDAGFGRGFWAIFDGQLTTGIAGFFLYQYGSGPIKGFAVMLMIGILCTLFTALWCTRLFFDFYISRRGKATVLGI